MPALEPIDPQAATGKAKELFTAVEQRMKRVPGMIRLLANSPAILDAYLHFNEELDHARLTKRLQGLIAATVSEINGCDYTLSTAMALGRRAGLSEDEINDARRGESRDPQTATALRFAAKTVLERGHLASSDVKELQRAGFSNQEVVEIIAVVALNIFRNYFNLIAGTEIDFPVVKGDSAR